MSLSQPLKEALSPGNSVGSGVPGNLVTGAMSSAVTRRASAFRIFGADRWWALPTLLSVPLTFGSGAFISEAQAQVQYVGCDLTIAEGGAGTCTVATTEEITNLIRVTLTSSDTTVATVSGPVTFSPGTPLRTTHTFTVTAVNDDIDHPQNPTADLISTVATQMADGSFSDAPTEDVGDVTVTDDDTAGLTLSRTRLDFNENSGDVETYTIVLDTEPLGPITVTLTRMVDNQNSFIVGPTQLIFIPSNWDEPQEVTVLDRSRFDEIDNPPRVNSIRHTVSGPQGSPYNGLTATLSVNTIDDDMVGLMLSTTELRVNEGEEETYTVRLSSRPRDSVTVGLDNSLAAQSTIQPTQLEFTTSNWRTPQTVTVDTVENDIDTDFSGRIRHTTMSDDDGYDRLEDVDLPIAIVDDDMRGVTLSRTELSVAEAGGIDTYTIVLDSEPSEIQTITVTPSSSDETVATVSDPLMFTRDTWNRPQTVTVTGVDDTSVNSLDRTVMVTHTIRTDHPQDTAYTPAGVSIAPVRVTAVDDDGDSGVVLSRSTLTVDEGGGMGTYTIVLRTQPNADVTITPTIAPTGVATVMPAELTFTASNWNTPQTVTVTGVDDDTDNDPDRTAPISHRAESGDGDYDGITVPTVVVTATDDDTAGLMLSATEIEVREFSSRSSMTYTVELTSQPSANVTVEIESGDRTVATVMPTQLIFTPSNWDEPQEVTVQAVTNNIHADNTTTIIHTATSNDTAFNGEEVMSRVRVIDSSSPPAGTLFRDSNFRVNEGGTGTYGISLTTEPTGTVTVRPVSVDRTVATVMPTQLTFTPANWRTRQTVTVTGVDDAIVNNPNRRTRVTHVFRGGGYDDAARETLTVSVTVLDNEIAGVTLSRFSFSVAEGGDTETYTVVLNTQPSANVTVTPESRDTEMDVLTISGPLTFTTSDWNQPQTVTVAGMENDIDVYRNEVDTIEHGVVSTDNDYNEVSVQNVMVTVRDNDTAGVTLSRTELAVAEAGGTETYTAVLDTQPVPGATITLTPESSDPTVATVSGSLTFTPENWSTEQTVTVTGVNDDNVNDPDRTVMVTHTLANSTNDFRRSVFATYGVSNRVSVDSVDVRAIDDDRAGGAVSTSELRIDEGGESGTYTIVLRNAPTADVTIAPTIAPTGIATVMPTELTFTTSNWNTPQTVTVTGMDDDIDNDPNRTATISHSTTSSDSNYNELTLEAVIVTVANDDTAGAMIAGVLEGGIEIDEAGNSNSATYTLRLTSEPIGEVTVTPAIARMGIATVMPAGGLTFDFSNWMTPQTVTVTAVRDFIDDDSDRTVIIRHEISGNVPNDGYDDMDNPATVEDVEVTVSDSDTAGVTLSSNALSVNELTTDDPPVPGSATYTIVLDSQPTGDVTIMPASSDMTVATVSGALTFTSSDWRTPQTVTVTAVDDAIDNDPDRTATISHEITGYGSVTVGQVRVTASDNDTAGAPVADLSPTTPQGTLRVDEDGGTGTYTIRLTSQPTGDVTVRPTSSDTNAATVSGALTFTPSNWDQPQTVTVTGVDDFISNDDDDTRTVTISHAITGYGSVTVAPVTVTVTDDDSAGVTVTPMDLSPLLDEDGGTVIYMIRLTSQPTHEVTLTPTSDDETIATVSGPLTFTPSNWDQPQDVTVTAVNDDIDNDLVRGVLITHTAASDDGNYDGPIPSCRNCFFLVELRDDDTAGVIVTPTTLTVDEAGGTGTYTIRLNSEPTADVMIMPTSDDDTVATVSVIPNSGTLTFTSINWNIPQEVTVRGVDDNALNDPDREVTISHTISGGGYGEVDVADVTVTASDNDTAGVTVTPTTLRVDEDGGRGTYTVVLDTQPTSNVTITPASADGTVATVSGALTFTPENWSTEQTVTVTGVNDDIDNEGDRRTTTISHRISGGGYGEANVANVTVTASDDDIAGVTVTPTTLRVDEDGGSGTYTVVLDTQPTGNVTIAPASTDRTVATVSGELTFTPENWSTEQTVTVIGVNDDIDNEDDREVTISHTISGGGYSGVSVAGVTVTATDDDTAGVTVTPTTLSVDEAGGSRTYTLVLDTQPTGDVTITPASEDGTVARVSGPLTFTPSNWNQTQTVTVTGVDDAIDNFPDRTTRVTHTISGGDYGSIVVEDVSVTAVDDEDVAISIRAVEPSVVEGETVQFQLTATPTPAVDLMVAIAVADPDGVLTEAAPTEVRIEANQSTIMLELETDDDAIDELDTTVTVTLEEVPDGNYIVAAAPNNRASVQVTDNDGLTRERREEGIKHALGAFGRAAGWDLAETIRDRSRNSAVQGAAFEITNLPGFGPSSLDGLRPPSMDLSELLERDTEIRVTFNPQVAQAFPSAASSSDKSPLVRAWIKASRRDVESDPLEGRTQEGEIVIGRFGVDVAYASGWLVGSAFSWHDGNIEFDDSTFATEGGVGVDLLSINPYVSFTKGKLHLWGTIGGGIGDLHYEDSPTDAGTSTSSDLRMLTAAVGAEYAFGRLGPFDLKGRGEGMIVDLDAEGSSHPLIGYDDIGVTVHGTRGELELGLPLQFDNSRSEFRPYVFTGLRQDGGLGSDLALEYGGGFAFRTRSLVAEGTIRSQGDREDDGVSLKGYSVSLAYDRGNDRKGLVARVEQSAGPSDYDPYGAGALSSLSPSAAGTSTRVHLGYGIGWDEKLLRPFVEMDWRESQQSDFNIGLEYQYVGGTASLVYSDGDTSNLGFRFEKLF